MTPVRSLGAAARRARSALPAVCVAMLAFGQPAAAQQTPPPAATVAAAEIERTRPHIAATAADWDAVRAILAGLARPEINDNAAGAPPPDALARLNALADKSFPNIAASSVPVLLPFDTAAYWNDEAPGSADDAAKYISGFAAPTFFLAGASGYDAALSVQPQDSGGADLSFANRVDVQISGAALVYELDAPVQSEESPVKELASDFPGMRRVFLEERLRYIFSRFGALYIVSIKCFEGANSARRLSCREADKIALRVIEALNIVGGSPPAVVATAPPAIERPEALDPDFTYYAPGDILPGTGMKGHGGRPDATVYADIRFPMAQAPAYANSQSFMNWGDCDFTGRIGLGGDGKTAAYRCRVNSVPLVRDESKNYAYPWRDNFCEHRDFYVGQCPAGLGHQGQDIRPGSCVLRSEGADRCEPNQHEVVAVRDGILMRAPGDKALYLVVEAPGEHIRFRYLHMDPDRLDRAGMVSGRHVSEGEVIGTVGNYGRRAGGTTYHLHFDTQVMSRDGWVFVSPYMTLVAAYERLIGGRGQVVRDVLNATASIGGPPAALPAPLNAMVAAGGESLHEHEAVSAEYCKTGVVRGHRRRLCEPDRAEKRERARHADAIRRVDRGVSHQGDGARHYRGDLYARHARATSRRHGA